MAGINRALYENRHVAKASESANKPCIFLSHIFVDKSAAMAVGTYIVNCGDIDIYLDFNDADLQEAVKTANHYGITQFIEQGLSHSTHIMCLVSVDTVKSWWVPYELGFAKNAGKHLSTLKLKGEIALPPYLQISEIIPGTKSLNDYLSKVRRAFAKVSGACLLTETLIPHSGLHPLDEHLDWNR